MDDVNTSKHVGVLYDTDFFVNIQGIHKRLVRFQFLDMLENWLLPQLNTNYDDYILHLDCAPPIFTGIYE